jgi:ABC-2 type transport system permease protein
VTFGGTLRSEWIKLRSLRSTAWCYGLILVLTVLFGLLLAVTFSNPVNLSDEMSQTFALQVSTLSIGFSQLVACVLGVLVISGEYGTGMIRSTFTAVPKRTPALLAKGLVFGGLTFVVALISIALTAVVTAPLSENSGIVTDFADPAFIAALAGGAVYLALIGVMSLAIGAIVRSSAGGIAAAVGLVLVLPTVIQIFAALTEATWAQNLLVFLPSNAGGMLYAYEPTAAVVDGIVALDALQGGLVLAGWVVVLFAAAIVLVKRRDV